MLQPSSLIKHRMKSNTCIHRGFAAPIAKATKVVDGRCISRCSWADDFQRDQWRIHCVWAIWQPIQRFHQHHRNLLKTSATTAVSARTSPCRSPPPSKQLKTEYPDSHCCCPRRQYWCLAVQLFGTAGPADHRCTQYLGRQGFGGGQPRVRPIYADLTDG